MNDLNEPLNQRRDRVEAKKNIEANAFVMDECKRHGKHGENPPPPDQSETPRSGMS